MPARTIVSVRYPLESGRMLLRTDADWEADLEPVDASEDCTRFDFDVAHDGPFRYFKPVLRRADGVHWSCGENHLALADGPGRLDVYPFFFQDHTCLSEPPFRLASRARGREHTLRVFCPPGYHENLLESLPVVYMHDGQNLFAAGEGAAGPRWRIEETVGALDAMNLARRALVVGIFPADRMADYTRPGYEDYGRYLVEEVKPRVDATFRTLRGPADTAVMGSSLGGVVSFFLAWEWPHVFGNAACLSSTFGYRDDLRERVAGEERRRIRVYLDSGWPADNYEVTRDMRDLLLRRGYREGRDLFYLAFPHARHHEDAWAERAHIPMQHLLGAAP